MKRDNPHLDAIKTNLQAGTPLLADGAMGTYFTMLTGRPASECEQAGLTDPDIIRRIHCDYLRAGARILRTNTFAVQPSLCEISSKNAVELVKANYRLAVEAAEAAEATEAAEAAKTAMIVANEADASRQIIVMADLGPNPLLESAEALQEYALLIDAFVECGATCFLFETFTDTELLPRLAAAVRERVPDALITASLAFSPDGFTRKGQSVEFALGELAACPDIDIVGMNCGVGPVHMLQLLERCGGIDKPLWLMPNAGYPALENQKSVFAATPEYFAQSAILLARGSTAVIGGCCGTTPDHIKALGLALEQPRPSFAPLVVRSQTAARQRPGNRPLATALKRERKVIVCEMDPPRDSQLEPLIKAARVLRANSIDLMTLADTPLSRVRLDPVVAGARIQRETGLPVLPHLCCRDRNVNSLRSSLLALHSENIRQVLLITGDPVPEQDRGYIKPVFNLNSISLLELASTLNRELFSGDELLLGAAFDPNVPVPERALERAARKIEAGASFFLTQPVYAPEAAPVLDALRKLGAQVLCGLMPPVSYRNVHYLANEVPGIRIPAEVLARFEPDMAKEAAVAAGIEATLVAARAVADYVDGFYLISPFNRADIAVSLSLQLADAGLL